MQADVSPRATSPAAGLRWLRKGVNTGRSHPLQLFTAAAVLGVLGLLPSAATYPLQAAAATNTWILGLNLLISTVGGLALVPAIGAFFEMIHRSETGESVQIVALFAPYRRGGSGLRLLAFGALLLAVYIVLFALSIVVAGKGLVAWAHRLELARAAHLTHSVPQSPDGLGILVLLLGVVFLFMAGVYALGLGQVAIARRPAWTAVREAMVGSVLNMVPITILTLMGLLVAVIGALAFTMAAALAAALGSLIAPWMGLALMIALYVASMLALYVVVLGTMYAMWRDVFGVGGGALEVAAESSLAGSGTGSGRPDLCPLSDPERDIEDGGSKEPS